MNGKPDRIYPKTSAEFPWEWDSLGTPYGLYWGLEFDYSDALDLGEYTPPGSLPSVYSLQSKLQKQEAQTAQKHLDSPISRHGQQAAALAHMRSSRGFAPCTTMRYVWRDGATTGTSRLYLQTGTEFWEEVKDA